MYYVIVVLAKTLYINALVMVLSKYVVCEVEHESELYSKSITRLFLFFCSTYIVL